MNRLKRGTTFLQKHRTIKTDPRRGSLINSIFNVDDGLINKNKLKKFREIKLDQSIDEETSIKKLKPIRRNTSSKLVRGNSSR
jgi:hypothetical protein